MTLKNAIGPALLGLALATTLSACGGGRHTESPAEYARARVPQFIEFLSSDKAEVRCAAAFGLGNIAPHAAEAVSALRCALFDQAPEVRDMAGWALCRMGVRSEELPAAAGVTALRNSRERNP